jgi:Iap family predicted aminopeptidase
VATRQITRGKNYYAEPIYKLPNNVPLEIAAICIIAKYEHAKGYATYQDIMKDWVKIVPHEKAYYMLTSLLNRRKHRFKRTYSQRGRTRIAKFTLAPSAYQRVLYYEKYLPPELIDPIRHILDKYRAKSKTKEELDSTIKEWLDHTVWD